MREVKVPEAIVDYIDDLPPEKLERLVDAEPFDFCYGTYLHRDKNNQPVMACLYGMAQGGLQDEERVWGFESQKVKKAIHAFDQSETINPWKHWRFIRAIQKVASARLQTPDDNPEIVEITQPITIVQTLKRASAVAAAMLILLLV